MPQSKLSKVTNNCMHQLDTTWIPFLIQMSQFCFKSNKNGQGYKTYPPEKLLQQFDHTTCLEML